MQQNKLAFEHCFVKLRQPGCCQTQGVQACSGQARLKQDWPQFYLTGTGAACNGDDICGKEINNSKLSNSGHRSPAKAICTWHEYVGESVGHVP